MAMNEKQGFVIEDLDDYHLVIKADDEWRVRKELETEVRVPQQRPFPSPQYSIPASLKRIHTAWNESIARVRYNLL